MCMYCERRQDVKFGWKQPALPLHNALNGLNGNIADFDKFEGHIFDYQTSQPMLALTKQGYFGGDGVGTVYIPINYCIMCGRKLGAKTDDEFSLTITIRIKKHYYSINTFEANDVISAIKLALGLHNQKHPQAQASIKDCVITDITEKQNPNDIISHAYVMRLSDETTATMFGEIEEDALAKAGNTYSSALSFIYDSHRLQILPNNCRKAKAKHLIETPVAEDCPVWHITVKDNKTDLFIIRNAKTRQEAVCEVIKLYYLLYQETIQADSMNFVMD